MPLVTAIIPVYNVQEYLARCVDSVIAQTHTNLEIILVDDGSTDRSGAVCDEYAARDGRIRVIHKANGGLSSARNAGLDAMTGSFVTFIDGDDYVHPEFVRRLLALLGDGTAQVAVAAWQELNEGDNPAPLQEPDRTVVYTRREALENMLYQRAGLTHSACSRLFRAEVFKDLRFTRGVLYEDIELIYKIMRRVGRLAFTTAAMYYYMHRPGSIITTVDVRRAQILDHLAAIRTAVAAEEPALLPAVDARELSASFNMLRIMPARGDVNASDTAAISSSPKIGEVYSSPARGEVGEARRGMTEGDVSARGGMTESDVGGWSMVRRRSEDSIRRLRRRCLRDPKVRWRDKAACLLSYMGMPLLFRLINNR